LANDLDRVCAVLTGLFKQMKKGADQWQAFIVGMTADWKFHVTTIIIGVPDATNRHVMGILVNAARQQDQKNKFTAVGMALDVTFTENATERKTDALYVCLENREGNAQDVVFPYKKKLLGGFKLDTPQSKPAEPRVYGPLGDELVALIKDKIKSTIHTAK